MKNKCRLLTIKEPIWSSSRLIRHTVCNTSIERRFEKHNSSVYCRNVYWNTGQPCAALHYSRKCQTNPVLISFNSFILSVCCSFRCSSLLLLLCITIFWYSAGPSPWPDLSWPVLSCFHSRPLHSVREIIIIKIFFYKIP